LYTDVKNLVSFRDSFGVIGVVNRLFTRDYRDQFWGENICFYTYILSFIWFVHGSWFFNVF